MITYWRAEGVEDKLKGYQPKTEKFFLAWFGDAGARVYQAYLAAYNATRKEPSHAYL